MRWLLLTIALAAGATAVYLGLFSRNSFSGYSREQLDSLAGEMAMEEARLTEAQRQRKVPDTLAEQSLRLQDNLRLLREERQRRQFFYLALAVTGLATVAAFFVRGGGSSGGFRLRGSSDEEARLLAAVGDPSVLREGARQKAASLLGVAPDAPPAVIEAALQAQLQQRDPAQLGGLAPDLKALVLQQREELQRARDLLLNQPGAGPTAPPKA